MFSRKLNLALDVGSQTIRFAGVEPETGRVRTLWERAILPERTAQDQTASTEQVEACLKEMASTFGRELNAASRGVVTAVQSSSAAFGYLELPPLSEKELKVAVPSRVAPQLPFSLEEVVLSFQTVPPLEKSDSKGVVYVAVPRRVLDPFADLLRRAGLEPKRVEVAPIALAREYGWNHPEDTTIKNDFSVVVNVGFQYTHVVMVRNGNPYYARHFSLAGSDFTYGLHMGNQSTWAEAENLKKKTDVTTREVSMEPFISRWIAEVQKSVQAFTTRHAAADVRVRRVRLSGATGLQNGLDRRLQEATGLPVSLDGWERLQPPRREVPAAPYKIAIGLALAE